MTANAWQVFDIFYEALGGEDHDLNSVDTIKVALVKSTWTPALTTDATASTILASHEADDGTGYTNGGYTVTATWDASTNTLTFDSTNPTWTASGGSIVARYALMYNASAGGSNDLIAYCLLDNTPDDVEATDGNTLTITMNGSGIFTIAQS